MNAISRKLKIFPFLFVLAGCGLFPPTLVEQGIVEVDIRETKSVAIYNATVYRNDGETVVRGYARLPSSVRHGVFRGHVDVELILPNGEAISNRDIRLTPRNGVREHGRVASFVSRFDTDPPRGTTARIQYHDGAHDESS